MDFAGVLPAMKTSGGQPNRQSQAVTFGSLQQSYTDMPKDIVSCDTVWRDWATGG